MSIDTTSLLLRKLKIKNPKPITHITLGYRLITDLRNEEHEASYVDMEIEPEVEISTIKCLISPLTGEKILASKLSEHMRIGLLDPRWIEQRDKLMEKTKEPSVYGSGKTVVDNLKHLAERMIRSSQFHSFVSII